MSVRVDRPRRRPLTPIFNPEKSTGALVVGNTPAYDLIVDLVSVTSISVTGTPRGISLLNSVLYVSSFTSDSIHTIDVSDPTAPAILDSISVASVTEAPYRTRHRGTLTFVGCGGVSPVGDRVTLVDAADVNNLSIEGSITHSTLLNTVTSVMPIEGTDACLAVVNDAARLTAVDTSTPTSPAIISSLNHAALNEGWDIALLSSEIAVISTLDSRIVTVDISDLSSMSVIGSLLDGTNLNQARNLAVRSDVAYVCAYSNSGFATVDLSNPASPVLLDSVTAAALSGAQGVAIQGNVAFVVSELGDSIVAINIADPSNLSILDSMSGLNGAWDIQVSGIYGFVTCTAANTLAVVRLYA